MRQSSTRMFVHSGKIWNCWKAGLCNIDAATESDLFPPLTTGRVCRKSPAKITLIPPNGRFTPVHTRNDSSKFCNRVQSAIGASSHMIILTLSRTRFTIAPCSGRPNIPSDGRPSRFTPTPNVEWNVRPLFSKIAAIPVEAVANASSPCIA